MAADPNFVQQVHTLLQQSTVPDTATVKRATDELQVLYKNASIIPALFQILATSGEAHIRQLAAVELRKRFAKKPKSWQKQPAEVRGGIKGQLLELIQKEESAPVRNASARVISEIARKELPANSWPELLPFLFNAANAPVAAQRQIAVFVFFTLLEVFTEEENVASYLPQIMQVFAKTLNDESLDVKITTVRGLGKVGDLLEGDAEADLAAVQSAVPQMVQVLSQCLEQGHSEGVKQVLDVFDTFCLTEAPILANYLGDLLDFYLTNGANDKLEDEAREACLNSASWTVLYKRQKVQQLNLAGPMIQRLMPVVVTGDIDLEEESTTPAIIALRLLDTLATEMPPSHVWPPLFEQVQSSMNNPDPRFRQAAMMALGICVEGVSETMRPQFDLVWSFVDRSLKDPEAPVRSAGCTALTYLCDVLGDECVKKHQSAVPTLMQLVGDAAIQRDACRALDAFLENLGDDIKQYLPLVMETLASYLESAPLKVKQSIIAAIGSAAHASGEEFVPYFQEIMKRLQPFLLAKDKDTDETMDVRASAQDAIGTISIAVGKEAFRPYFSEIMGHAFDALSLGQPRLNECSFIFFSTMAKVFGEEFSTFLPQIMPKVIESLKQLEHDPVPGAAGDGTVNGLGIPGSSAAGGDEDDDEDYVDLEDLDEIFGNVNSAIAVEKEVATDAVGEIFKYTKSGFLPYLQESVTQLVSQLQHYSSGIRKAALSSLFVSIDTLNKVMDPPQWQPGLQVKVPLNSDVQQMVDLIINDVLMMWEDEDDRMVAIQFCESLSECLNEVGPAIIAKNFGRIAEIAMSILEKKSIPQSDPDGEEAAEETDSSEYEVLLINSAMDLVGALANVLGPDFVQPLQTFLPHISKYYAPTRSSSERAGAVSALGEIVAGMKSDITPFTQDILAVLSRALSDPDASVRSNATFAAGVLIEKSDADLSQHFGALLQALQPSFQITNEETAEDSRNLRDNACGCLARLILKRPDAIPLDQTLPLLFGALPLLEDMAEWAPVMQCSISLINSQNPVAMQNIDTMLQLFAHVLATGQTPGSEDVLGAELRGQTVAFVSHLNTQFPDKIQQAGLTPYLV